MTEKSSDQCLIPYLNVRDAEKAIAFYREVFSAKELYRLTDPNDGRIGHAELLFGNARVMISDEYPDFGAVAPSTLGGTPIKLVLTVDCADDTFALALEHGAIEVRKLNNEFFGHRSGLLSDPFGHLWFVQTRTEDLSPETMQRRWNESAQL